MPYLRNAVEKRRDQVITFLVKSGTFKREDIQSLTLSELEVEYKKVTKISKGKKGVLDHGK